MKTKLIANLEDVMEKFIDDNCEDVKWPDGYTYHELNVDMAKAAAAVFDANFRGQDILLEIGG